MQLEVGDAILVHFEFVLHRASNLLDAYLEGLNLLHDVLVLSLAPSFQEVVDTESFEPCDEFGHCAFLLLQVEDYLVNEFEQSDDHALIIVAKTLHEALEWHLILLAGMHQSRLLERVETVANLTHKHEEYPDRLLFDRLVYGRELKELLEILFRSLFDRSEATFVHEDIREDLAAYLDDVVFFLSLAPVDKHHNFLDAV